MSADERALMNAQMVIFSWGIYKDGMFVFELPFPNISFKLIKIQ